VSLKCNLLCFGKEKGKRVNLVGIEESSSLRGHDSISLVPTVGRRDLYSFM
jgi:hypothetical protein